MLFLIPAPAFAQSNGGIEKITMSPSSRTIKLDAGTVLRGSMDVINSGDVAFSFKVYTTPYTVSGESYDPNFTRTAANADAYSWVKLEKTDYPSLEPGQMVTVPYTIHVPETAAPGGHYGVIFAETKAREIGQTGVARQKRVGQILYLTVNGNYISGGKIAGFNLPFWQTKPPVVSTARVSNTGNVDFETEVRTVAKDLFGRTKFTYSGDPIVLPQTTRLIEMNWDKAPNFGLYNVSQSVKFLGSEHTNSNLVLVAPRWFPILLIIIVLSGVSYAVVQRR
jgi:hypothetical protein